MWHHFVNIWTLPVTLQQKEIGLDDQQQPKNWKFLEHEWVAFIHGLKLTGLRGHCSRSHAEMCSFPDEHESLVKKFYA